MNEMKNNEAIKELGLLSLGELVVSVITVLGYFLISLALESVEFSWRVVTGALLGVAVVVANHTFLIISVNRAVENYMALRGTREMSDEEAEQFARENSLPIQNSIKLSFIIRTVTMLLTLVLAFLIEWFNPIATAIPILAFRPILYVIEIIKGKKSI